MLTLASSKYLVVAGAVTVAATMGVGVASAGPDLGPIINTTCNYAQVTAALNVVSPDMAAKLAQNPMVSSRLQSFLAAPVDERQQMAQQAMARGRWRRRWRRNRRRRQPAANPWHAHAGGEHLQQLLTAGRRQWRGESRLPLWCAKSLPVSRGAQHAITSGTMTEPAAVQRSPKYHDIVAAAQVLFGEVGYDKTGVREIAERAHIALGTLYSQFPDGKIGVLSAAMTERVERLMDHISRTERSEPVEAFLDRVRRLSSEIVRDPFLRKLFLEQGPGLPSRGYANTGANSSTPSLHWLSPN